MIMSHAPIDLRKKEPRRDRITLIEQKWATIGERRGPSTSPREIEQETDEA